MYSKFDNCADHPLGILCKCTDYQKIVNKFTFCSIGTEHYSKPKMNVGEQKYEFIRCTINLNIVLTLLILLEPIASAEISWRKNRLKFYEEISKPMLIYPREKEEINACNVNEMWIPIAPNLIPLKYILKI